MEVRTGDGRVLGYLELGDAGGAPVLALDGPGSRALAKAAAPAAERAGVRLVAPDRPGFLDSAPAPDRTILDWANDAIELADELGLERFGLLAQSRARPSRLRWPPATPTGSAPWRCAAPSCRWVRRARWTARAAR